MLSIIKKDENGNPHSWKGDPSEIIKPAANNVKVETVKK